MVVADADVAAGLRAALLDGPDVLITTGGTGASPTDRTPEATAAVPALRELLSDLDVEVKKAASRALGVFRLESPTSQPHEGRAAERNNRLHE